MADKPVLYGFDGSTYVRTARMVLADKGVEYDQVPVNVLQGEPRQDEHLQRHPFGKVPVLDIDGIRIRETDAICAYLEAKYPEPALMPSDPVSIARMWEAISLINSYGYDAMLGTAGYHLFPDFLGNPSESDRNNMVGEAEKVLKLLMSNKGQSPFLAGGQPTLADYFLAPIVFYIAQTPEKDGVFALDGVTEWYDRIKDIESFQQTKPDM